MAAEAASVYPALENRPVKDTICLFDVDGTLTPARRVGCGKIDTLLYFRISYHRMNHEIWLKLD
jgi:hypothetical protein